METFTKEDSLVCHFQRIRADENTYEYCKFFKNKTHTGGWVLEGQEMRPQISFHPRTQGTATAEVEAYFQRDSLQHLLGIFYIY